MEIISAQFIKGVVGTDDILYDGVPQVAFVGRSNVGKSSVINSLTNRRALVKPGKTTEMNFFSINDRALYLVDLPGYGYAMLGPKQKEKIEKLILWYVMYSEAKPKRVVLILDVKAGLTDFDKEMLRVLKEHGHPSLIVANKCDKLNQKDLGLRLKAIQVEAGEAPVLPYSASEHTGRERLLEAVFG
jgi:GTP-binding protein